MMDIGFVVLHYRTIGDTINCVNSILKYVNDALIVIVDNGSENNTGKKLKKVYKKIRQITVICCEKNLGFAKGNNIGIEYLRNTYSFRFIVVMNNDTLIKQRNFKDIILEEYKKSSFAVLGPQIRTKDGTITSNPVEYIVDSKRKAFILLIKRYIKLFLNKLYLNVLIHDIDIFANHKGKYNHLLRYEDIKLHGACWVFSDKFFEKYNGINDSTFLYFEEDILYLETVKQGLKTVYNPQLSILHLEDSSTNSLAKNTREKNIFVLSNEIRSLKILIKILDQF